MTDTSVPSLPAVIARDHVHASRQQVWFAGDRFVQGGDLNDLQLIARRRHDDLGRLIVKDGDRVEGCEVLVNREDNTITLGSGRLYVAGAVVPVSTRIVANAPLVGRVQIGVRVARQYFDHEQDPDLRGQVPGTEAEGEAGNYRESISVAWVLDSEQQAGDFVPVYLMLDGTIIDHAPPPALTGVMQQIGIYDFDANGHYIVDGCEVRSIGKAGADWVFSIGAGTANIEGFKRIRETAIRHAQIEEVDLEDIVAETHTFTGATGGTTTISVNRAPIAQLTSAVVIKRVTETVVRGAVPGTADALQFSSVLQIENVMQGGNTIAGTAYQLTAGQVSWSPEGAEPAAGSSYQVTYLYSDAVSPTELTETTVTVGGGVQGSQVTLRYNSKLPRIDLICLNLRGEVEYVKGISSRRGAMAPIAPSSLLKLAEVHNTWLGLPRIVNDPETRRLNTTQMNRLFSLLILMADQFDRQSMLQSITEATPVSRAGIFTENFVDDFFRDQGEAQTAACNQGVLQLAIDNVLMQAVGGDIVTMPYVEQILVSQTQRTSSIKINPYDNFVAMPAGMRIAPATDFWTEQQTLWTSGVTREFTTAPDQPPGQTVINEMTELRQVRAPTLRQQQIKVNLEGFGVGENLSLLTFDNINVKPAGTQTADANGEIELVFMIPANVPSGRRLMRAEGAAGSFAEAIYVGEGTIDIATMRRVTLIARAAPVPVINNITNITNNITEVTQITNNTIVQQVVGGGGNDPLAQTFMVPRPAMVVGVNFWFTAIGDRTKGVRVQLATVLNGYPTADVLAETFINMQAVSVGEKIEARFEVPIYCAPQREYCFVILTADGTHAVAISKLGDVDENQVRVGSQPYTVGVLFSSANRLTWTPHQDADMAFEIVAAQFTQTSRVVNLWTGSFDQISDLIVRGSAEVPTEVAGFHYELVRATGEAIRLTPSQTVQFNEFISENVTLRAVLSGTAAIGPVLFPGTLIVGGRLRTSGTYISRRFPFGSNVFVNALFAAKLPVGSGVAVEYRTESDWVNVPLLSTGTLGGGWIEPKHRVAGITGIDGQIRISLSGTPSARPSISQLRAYPYGG